MTTRVDVLVIGSGAGGAVTALELAKAGRDVLVLEEGARHDLSEYGAEATTAMRKLYRRRGMTPILGSVPIGWVEGCAVGGSTEINSGFWHRAPPEVLHGWKARWDLIDASPEQLAPHYAWAEERLHVGVSKRPWPESTKLFAKGIEAMGWSWQEVPRAALDCRGTNTCASGCATGAKQGMSRSILPDAEAAGARILAGARAEQLVLRRGRVEGAIVRLTRPDCTESIVRVEANHVFVCAGATETPALLRRSGVRRRVGDRFLIHPMLKVAAEFDHDVDAGDGVLPLLQVREFSPGFSLGGSYFTPGHLAMLLGENWPTSRDRMALYRRLASYYVAVPGSGRGTVRPRLFGDGAPELRYEVSHDDLHHLGCGLARLASLLLAAGAKAVYPGVQGLAPIRTQEEALRWLDEPLPKGGLALTTVHAFSSCPGGERRDLTAADSYGRVHDVANLRLSDASLLPDSPGVNPQGTVMALARRNAHHFLESAT